MTGIRSWLHATAVFISIVHVCRAQMIVEPSAVVLESGNPQYINMTCSPSLQQSVSVQSILAITIKRNSTREQRNSARKQEVLASILTGKPAELGTAEDITRRNLTVSGDISSPQTAGLYVIWNTTTVECEDTGDYECEITYWDHGSDTFTSSMSLSVQTLPSDIRLMVFKNNITIQPDEGTTDNRLSVDVGDVVDMGCSGKIGSNSSTLIEWYWTDPLNSSMDVFKRFTPGEGDLLDVGKPISVNACQYQRESMLQYNVTTMDLERENIAFKCSVTVDLPDQGQRTVEGDRVIYLHAASAASTTSNGVASTTVSIPENNSSSGATTTSATVPGNNTTTSIAALTTNFFNLQIGLIILTVCMAN